MDQEHMPLTRRRRQEILFARERVHRFARATRLGAITSQGMKSRSSMPQKRMPKGCWPDA